MPVLCLFLWMIYGVLAAVG